MLAVITGICAFMMLLVDGFAVFLFFILITTLWTVLYFLIRPASRTQMVLPPQPTPSDDYSPGRMASVLEYLGLPLDSNSGGSEDALKGGMIKSSIYMVCETLHRREFDESKKLLDNLFESVDSSDEVNRRVCAVILYLKGLACEGGKDPDQAREMYKKSLEFDPEYSRAMEQQEYLSRQE